MISKFPLLDGLIILLSLWLCIPNAYSFDAKDKAVLEGNKIIADAREAIQQEKVAMVSQMKKDMASFSIEIAEKVIRRELLDKTSQEALVSSLISEAKLN